MAFAIVRTDRVDKSEERVVRDIPTRAMAEEMRDRLFLAQEFHRRRRTGSDFGLSRFAYRVEEQ
jgi:hypothetical protein